MFLQCLLYADDLVILSETRAGLERFLNRFDKTASQFGLTVSVRKTKVMEVAEDRLESHIAAPTSGKIQFI